MKGEISWLGRVVCAAVVCMLSASVASADVFNLALFRQGGQYYAEVYCKVEAGTQARMQQAESGWIDFDMGDEVEIEGITTDAFGSLDALNSKIAGNYTLEIYRSEAKSVYSFTIATVQAGWFPDAPILNAVPTSIPQQYTFQWTWSTPAAVKNVEYDVQVGGEEVFEAFMLYAPTDLGFDDLFHEADFGAHTGPGTFFILYGNLTADLLTDWTLVEGDDVFSDVAPLTQYVWSEDLAEFNVGPEPATLIGDANLDGVVDAADYITVKQHFGMVSGAAWSQGDFNDDGSVNWTDLQMLMSALSTVGSTPGVTPEPATLGLLAIGALAVIRRRRKA